MRILSVGCRAALARATRRGAAVAGLFRRRAIVVTLAGRSMEPTFFSGERVLVRRAPATAVRRDDIVLVHLTRPRGDRGEALPAGGYAPMVKRVAALPGDAAPPGFTAAGITAGDLVPPGRLLLIGDNALMSYDSRQAGFYDAAAIVGIVTGRAAS